MARVPYMEDDDLVEPARGRVLGHHINLFRALAHSPEGLDSFAEIGEWIRYRSVLDARLRELAILAVGAYAKCRYEFSHHVKIGRDFGLTDEDISGLLAATRGQASNLGPIERRIVAAAGECLIDGAVSAPTYAALASELDHEQMVELVLILAHYAGVVRVLESLAIDVEEDYEHYLEEFPLEG